MSTNALSVEQSVELIRRGVRPAAASMMRIDFGDSSVYVCGEQAQTVIDCVKGKYIITENRVFTITDISYMLPKSVQHNNWMNSYEIKIYWTRFSGWHVCYCCPQMKDIWHRSGDDLIELLYDALIWTLDNDFVLHTYLKE